MKFALGENPKRSPTRYPNTRMGVQEIIRDHFLAARDYEKEWKRWEKDEDRASRRAATCAWKRILDILNQKLLVSSHGYRADEFLALVRLAEEFGFRIQTLQHGVEAYKIATELKNVRRRRRGVERLGRVQAGGVRRHDRTTRACSWRRAWSRRCTPTTPRSRRA